MSRPLVGAGSEFDLRTWKFPGMEGWKAPWERGLKDWNLVPALFAPPLVGAAYGSGVIALGGLSAGGVVSSAAAPTVASTTLGGGAAAAAATTAASGVAPLAIKTGAALYGLDWIEKNKFLVLAGLGVLALWMWKK